MIKPNRTSIQKQEKKLGEFIEKKYQVLIEEMIGLAGRVVKSEQSTIIQYLVSLSATAIEEKIREVSIDVFQKEAMKAYKGMSLGVGFNVVNKMSLDYIANRNQYTLGTRKTTVDKMTALFTDVINNNKTLDEAVEMIENNYSVSANRARFIATNELGHAFVQGTDMSLRRISTENVDINFEKRWNTVNDSRVTQGCRHNENEGWVPMEHTYADIDGMGGGKTPPRFIGCRCTLDYNTK